VASRSHSRVCVQALNSHYRNTLGVERCLVIGLAALRPPAASAAAAAVPRTVAPARAPLNGRMSVPAPPYNATAALMEGVVLLSGLELPPPSLPAPGLVREADVGRLRGLWLTVVDAPCFPAPKAPHAHTHSRVRETDSGGLGFELGH
jgi:hypothetical protein